MSVSDGTDQHPHEPVRSLNRQDCSSVQTIFIAYVMNVFIFFLHFRSNLISIISVCSNDPFLFCFDTAMDMQGFELKFIILYQLCNYGAATFKTFNGNLKPLK